MKFIFGLGNIGKDCENTRHNAGFMVLDELVKELEQKTGNAIEWKAESKLKCLTAKVPYKGQILFLAKPTTFMNLSGQAISSVLNFFKEETDKIIVMFDDIDLPLGTIRTRTKGSAGTHNGIKSVIKELGTEEFNRIKIGIESRGTFAPKEQDLHSFVLSKFSKEETEVLENSIQEAITELKKLISS